MVIGSVLVNCGCGRHCCGRLWLWLTVLWLMVIGSVVADGGCG